MPREAVESVSLELFSCLAGQGPGQSDLISLALSWWLE